YEDLARPGAERFPDADLTRSLLHVHEHNVHDAHAPDGQRDHADEREDHFQAVDDGARDFGGLRRPEQVERTLIGRVVTVAVGEILADLPGGLRFDHRCRRLPDERIDVLVVRQPAHRGPRYEHAELVGPVVVRHLDLVDADADDFERLAADTDGLADRRDRAEQLSLYL